MSEGTRAAGPELHVLAPCKINPYLEIVARRPDGFHELVTTMLALELADELRLRASERPGVRLELSGPAASADIPTDERNLALRVAAGALERARAQGARVPPGLELGLVKRIPSQAGLGGGSADAAASLRAVELLLAHDLGSSVRHELLAGVGSDCVFFSEASSGYALCEGRGERVQVLPAPTCPLHVALITPEARCPTAAIFAALEPPFGWTPVGRDDLVRMLDSSVGARAALFNRLESAAQRVVPSMAAWRDCLQAARASHFRLSGSGSSLFGLFSEPSRAAAALDRIRAEASERDLDIRGSWVLKPASSGVVRI